MNLHDPSYFTNAPETYKGWKPPLPPVIVAPDLLRETIYDTLHHRLITGRILPGIGLSTRGVARELGVSQMPVREAMTRLAAEGVVDIRSRRHVMVRTMTVPLLEDLRCCRILFESEAIKRAQSRFTKTLGLELDQHLARIRSAAKTDDSVGVLEAEYDFHFTLYRAAGNPILLPFIDSLWLRFIPYLRAAYDQFGVQTQYDMYQSMIALLPTKESDKLLGCLAAQINATMSLVGKPVLPLG